MSKRTPLTEAVVLAVIRSTGRFGINPMMYRNAAKMKLLSHMVKAGTIKKRLFKLDYAEYTIPPTAAKENEK